MLAIRILGPLDVDDAGVPLVIKGPMTQALLVCLALEAGNVVSMSALVDALWGDDPPSGATNALQVKVSELRRVIGSQRIVARRPGYVLDVPPESVDALEADALIARARRFAGSDPAAASTLYDRALALWRGPALSSVSASPFAAAASTRWLEIRLGAIEERARLRLAAGETRPLIGELEVVVAEHGLREPLVEVLMLALAAEGRQVAALAAYRELRVRLVSELGIDPSPRLQMLEHQVLAQDPAIVSIRPSLEGSVAPERSAPSVTRLPHPVSSFIRRDDDLAAVARLMQTRRLVTITGPGGVGKSRLAIEVARHIGQPTDGVWFVPLEAVTDAAGVPDALAHGLGAVGSDPMSAVRDRLRNVDLLVVLDNCEHLADVLSPLIQQLLEDAPGVRCLATSQRTLGIPGEAQWPLAPLPRAQAIELFVERARDVAPRTPFDDVDLIGELCAQLDDLPLAIELAAGRCGVLSVQEVVDRLRDRFALLRDQRVARIPRQQTLEATISWSYDLLFPDAQLALQTIASCSGGVSIAGYESMMRQVTIPGEELLDLVAQLVDRSLVVTERSGETIRYFELEGVRSFAVGRARDDGRAEELAKAQASWVGALAHGARRGVRGVEQQSWLGDVRAERGNIDAALSWMSAHAPLDALGVVADLYLAWMMLGDSEAGAARALRAIAGADGRAPSPAIARAEAAAAQLLARSGAPDKAVELALRARSRIGDGVEADDVEINAIVGRVLIHAGRYEEGCELEAAAATRFVELGDDWDEAMAYVSIGWAEYLNGRVDRAERAASDALEAIRVSPDGWVTHAAHRLLGVLAADAGDYPLAQREFHAALEVARTMGSSTDEGQVLARIAVTHLQSGDSSAALGSYREALRTSRQAGDHVTVTAAREALEALTIGEEPSR